MIEKLDDVFRLPFFLAAWLGRRAIRAAALQERFKVDRSDTPARAP